MNNVSNFTVKGLPLASSTRKKTSHMPFFKGVNQKLDLLKPLREWLNGVEVKEANFAHRLCQLIPSYCPFERNIKLGSYSFHIPPLCKLNPLYEEVVALRFRALCYLADECGEDVSAYC